MGGIAGAMVTEVVGDVEINRILKRWKIVLRRKRKFLDRNDD